MDELALENFFYNLDRSFFIDNEYKKFADNDSPLPIGFEQTISQPSLVLEMTRLLSPENDSKVLEIGTGSGYQTSILAEFAKVVYSVERIRELSKKAQDRLSKLGYNNIFFKIDDGSIGWKENSPFDRIMVTAAAGKIPEELIEQLNVNGKMIIPVGPEYFQDLLLIEKDYDGNLIKRVMGQVRFVELIGNYGWNAD